MSSTAETAATLAVAQPSAPPTETHRAGYSAAAMDPDLEFVERARAGDTRAFTELVERHGAAVKRVAARVGGLANADDVVQDVFLRAYHRLDGFEATGSFRSWLLRIAHNAAVDEATRRLPEPVDPQSEAHEGPTSPDEREPVSRLEALERRERMQIKLGALRPQHRAVLVLRDVEGLSYEEIASVTDTPLGSVKGRIHRARSELIDVLRANTYDWELPE